VTESRPNAEQSEYWNTIAGPKWLDLQHQLDLQLAPYGRAALEAAHPAFDESVVDVGCGCGATTLELGKRVGETGRVLGVDIASAMIARARATAEASGRRNVAFECTDAQTFPFARASVGLVYSRFGVMFFADPVAAFRNLARALRPNGRLAFVCWQSIHDNPWMSVPMMAAMQHITLDIPADPHAPGPFAFADAERVCGMLQAAGFTEARASAFRTDMLIGGGAPLEQAMDFMLRISPLSRPLAEVDAATRHTVIEAIRRAVASYEVGGIVRMPSAAWIITAQKEARP